MAIPQWVRDQLHSAETEQIRDQAAQVLPIRERTYPVYTSPVVPHPDHSGCQANPLDCPNQLDITCTAFPEGFFTAAESVGLQRVEERDSEFTPEETAWLNGAGP